ncbi:hypothetical protein RUND412_009316 [Rhizina undulata]
MSSSRKTFPVSDSCTIRRPPSTVASILLSTDASTIFRTISISPLAPGSNFTHLSTVPVHIPNPNTFPHQPQEIHTLSTPLGPNSLPANGTRTDFTFTETVKIFFGLWAVRTFLRGHLTVLTPEDGSEPVCGLYEVCANGEPGDKGPKIEVRKVRVLQDSGDGGTVVKEDLEVTVPCWALPFSKGMSERAHVKNVEAFVALFEEPQEEEE